MSTAQLIMDLNGLGISLEADGGRLLYCPRSAITPDLMLRLVAHKAELLAMLQPATCETCGDPDDASTVWQRALDQLERDAKFPRDLIDELRMAEAEWGENVPSCDGEGVRE